MMEHWNNGMVPFGQINAYGGDSGEGGKRTDERIS
jgi:hypothetical protein